MNPKINNIKKEIKCLYDMCYRNLGLDNNISLRKQFENLYGMSGFQLPLTRDLGVQLFLM